MCVLLPFPNNPDASLEARGVDSQSHADGGRSAQAVSRSPSCMLCAPAGAVTYAKGVDVSNWQATVDWLQVGDDGYTFMFAKASEGHHVHRHHVSGEPRRCDGRRACTSARTTSRARRDERRHDRPRAPSRRPTTSSTSRSRRPATSLRARPRGERRPLASQSRQVDAGVGERGRSPHRRERDDLRVARLLEDVARRHTGLCGNRQPAVDRALDEGRVADRARLELERARLDVLAVDVVPDGAGLREVRRRRPCRRADRRPVRDQARIRPGAPSSSTPPTIVGTAKAGGKLAGLPGTWAGGKPVAFSYQWQSCDAAGAGCSPIAGANLETYTPTTVRRRPCAVARRHRCGPARQRGRVDGAHARRRAGRIGHATAPAVVTAPQVTGEAQVGQTLTAAVGSWTGSPTTFAFHGAAATPAARRARP